MRTADLDYPYPPELIATEPSSDYRILLTDSRSAGEAIRQELQVRELVELFQPGDVLVINDTRVIKRRVFAGDLEILFVDEIGSGGEGSEWSVLFPAREVKLGTVIALPGNVQATLIEKGLPQKVRCDRALDASYFAEHGEYALPPYIQKARGERHSRGQDEKWYQTAWAGEAGSCAAPTASLHFSQEDLKAIEARGVSVQKLTLHVGIGTFLPVRGETLDQHQMHKEYIEIPEATVAALKTARQNKKEVWALGTTVTRALESFGQNMLTQRADGSFFGESDLFIRPGYEWQWVDNLLTNFHQPKSTLLAMVAAFAGLEKVLASYRLAVEKRFRLFSYGDLSVWRKRTNK